MPRVPVSQVEQVYRLPLSAQVSHLTREGQEKADALRKRRPAGQRDAILDWTLTVWVDKKKRLYYLPGQHWGNTKETMSKVMAEQAGYHQAHDMSWSGSRAGL